MSERGVREGGRRAERRKRPPVPRPRLGQASAAVAVLAVASVLVLVTPARPDADRKPAAATGEAVRETTLGCPRLLSRPDGTDTSYVVAAAKGVGDETGAITTTPGDGLALPRGNAAEVESSTQQGLVVRGTDGAARGLFAWRADTGSGTAVAECAAPSASWWFAGAGAAIDHESRLVLTNVDSGPAVVDLRVLSPDGEVDVADTGGRAIEVPAGARVSLSLVDLTPQNDELSLWVHATRGRVVAAMFDRLASSPTAQSGYEWMPSVAQPARTVRLSGVLADARTQTLLVANPSDSEALVSVELAGAGGRFVPAGLDQLSVPPGSVESLDLSAAAPGEPFAVRLRSQRPVVATVRSALEGGDTAYAAAVEPLAARAAAPVVGSSTVQLTAGADLTRADLTAFSSDGRNVGSTRLSVAANATVTWKVPKGAAYVVLDPVQGAPVASMVYDGATAPFQLLPDTVLVPVVRPAS